MGRVIEVSGGSQDHRYAYEIEGWYRRTTGGALDNKKYTFLVGRDTNKDIKALVLYSDYTEYSITMDVCAPRAMTRGLIQSMWDYPFNQIKVYKVFGFIDARNTLSQRTFFRMGCRQETQIRDFFGKGLHRLVYVATREDVKKWVTS